MSHIPPLDPIVAARKGFREVQETVRRFWSDVTVGRHSDGGWAVLLVLLRRLSKNHARLLSSLPPQVVYTFI